AGGPRRADFVVDEEPGAEDRRVADASRQFPRAAAGGGDAAHVAARVDAVAVDRAVEMIRIDPSLGNHVQLQLAQRRLAPDRIEKARRIAAALPLQPGLARALGVE